MRKDEFLSALRDRLACLPIEDVDQILEYYSEMIDERMEDGFSEEEAVRDVGSIDDAVASAVEGVPLSRLIRKRVRPRRTLQAWEIVLILLGAPVWVPLLIAAVAVAFSLCIALWAVVISFYAATVSLAVAALASLAAMFPKFFTGAPAAGMAALSAALISAGLAILFFHLSTAIARGVIRLGKIFVKGIKHMLVRKEAAQ